MALTIDLISTVRDAVERGAVVEGATPEDRARLGSRLDVALRADHPETIFAHAVRRFFGRTEERHPGRALHLVGICLGSVGWDERLAQVADGADAREVWPRVDLAVLRGWKCEPVHRPAPSNKPVAESLSSSNGEARLGPLTESFLREKRDDLAREEERERRWGG